MKSRASQPAALNAPRRLVNAVASRSAGTATTASMRSLTPSARRCACISSATLRAAASLLAELAPVDQRHFVRPATRGRQRRAPEARLARRGLHRQRLVGEQLAIAGDGQRVVVEVDAVHVW